MKEEIIKKSLERILEKEGNKNKALQIGWLKKDNTRWSPLYLYPNLDADDLERLASSIVKAAKENRLGPTGRLIFALFSLDEGKGYIHYGHPRGFLGPYKFHQQETPYYFSLWYGKTKKERVRLSPLTLAALFGVESVIKRVQEINSKINKGTLPIRLVQTIVPVTWTRNTNIGGIPAVCIYYPRVPHVEVVLQPKEPSPAERIAKVLGLFSEK